MESLLLELATVPVMTNAFSYIITKMSHDNKRTWGDFQFQSMKTENFELPTYDLGGRRAVQAALQVREKISKRRT